MKKKEIRFIAIISSSVLLLLMLCFSILYLIRNRPASIAFYEVPESMVDAVQTLAAEAGMDHLEFKILTDEQILSGPKIRKTDVLITGNVGLSKSLMDQAQILPDSIRRRYAKSIKDSPFYSKDSFRIMPLVLDHFETSFFTVIHDKSGQTYPFRQDSLIEYAEKCREFVEYPLLCAGGEDENLFALISVLAESAGGLNGYYRMIEELSSLRQWEQILALPIMGDAPEGTTFSTLLDQIKQWQQEGLLLTDWYNTSEETISVFMEDNHAAVVFMMLSEHRRKPHPMIRYFQSAPFPSDSTINRAVVQPSINAIVLNNKKENLPLLELLSSASGQEELSMATMLAPAALQGASYDLQADDVRFYASAAPGGPIPDISAAFTDKAFQASIVKEIRLYLSNP